MKRLAALAYDSYAIFIGEKHDCGITKSFTQSYRQLQWDRGFRLRTNSLTGRELD